jgi:alkylhydroperoxidase/carboxymuconolactone decarboxylase family protein YurZ
MKMKALVLLAVLAFPIAISADTEGNGVGCTKCGQNAAAQVALRTIPGSNEKMLVGSVENLIPIGVVIALGCEPCAEKVVAWALDQGSSFEDVERALQTVAAMQKLDCFKETFGGAHIEKPLAAARRALEQAKAHAWN